DVPADAGDPGEERAGFSGDLAGAMAGFSHAAFRGRRVYPAGASLQKPPGIDAGVAPDCARRFRAEIVAAGQENCAGAAGLRLGLRTQSRAVVRLDPAF